MKIIMKKSFIFLKTFFNYCFHAQTKQRPIQLVMVGLTLCSLSLLVLQSVMSGLQSNLIKKGKSIQGYFEIRIPESENEQVNLQELISILKKRKIPYLKAYSIEVLLREGSYIAPSYIIGIDREDGNSFLPEYLRLSNTDGIILGADLAAKLKMGIFRNIQILSPSHFSSLLGDVPLLATEEVSDLVSTEIGEVDNFYSWTRASFLHNLTRSTYFNRLFFYNDSHFLEIKSLLESSYPNFKLVTWEETHAELMWAFRLETFVMVGIFTMMALLVSLTIISAFNLFFTKIRLEIFTFWMLGNSDSQIKRNLLFFTQFITIISILSGVLLGGIIIFLLKYYSPAIMPDVFVERSLPVSFQITHLLYAFFIPYLISLIFTFFSLKTFFREQSEISVFLRRINA